MKLESLHEDGSPEIVVDGVGKMSLRSAKQNVREKIADMLRTVKTDDPGAWQGLHVKMKDEAMHAILNAIAQAEK